MARDREPALAGLTWEGVLLRLERYADIEASARECGALRRARAVRTGAQLLRLVLAYAVSGLSLRSLSGWAAASGEASLSDVALLKRFRRCGPWLASLVGTLNAALQPEGALATGERRVVAVDASAVCSPGGRDKPYRLLHTVYDVGAQHFRTTLVTDRHRSERLDVGEVARGEIRLGDRVYARYRDLAAVQEAGADYIVRLSARALRLADATGARFSRAALCRRAQAEGRVLDVAVRIQPGGEGPKHRPECDARIVCLPLPPEQAEAARRRMRRNARDWGYTPSDDALECAGCFLLVTSLDARDWPAERILALYRRRWQVELAFKRLKSLLALEKLRVFDPDLAGVWIHAVLLTALLVDLDRPRESEEPDSPPRGPESDAGVSSPSGA